MASIEAIETTSTETQIPREVVEYLDKHHIVTVATASFTGMPHAQTVAFVSDEHALYFAAPADAVTVRDVELNRYVSFTIDDYATDWTKTRGLQGLGTCTPIVDDEVAVHALGLFAAKFPRMPSPLSTQLFRITPREVHFVDNEHRPDGEGGETLPTNVLYRIFDELPADGSHTVAAELDWAVYGSGDVIARQGEDTDRVFVVVHGEVEVRREGHGADQTVKVLGPGHLFGETAILRSLPSTASVHALSPTMLLVLDRAAVGILFGRQ